MPRLSQAPPAQLGLRTLALLQAADAHRLRDAGRLRELDVAVVDRLDVVSPRVAEVERGRVRDPDAGRIELGPEGLLVVDDEAEMAIGVRRLGPAAGERDELVAHVHESHGGALPAAQLEVEEAAVPGQSLVDVAHLEGDMVDADEL